MSELTTLDERLAEIDERLRALQSGLDEPDTSSPPPVPAAAAPGAPAPVATPAAPDAPSAPAPVAPAAQPAPPALRLSEALPPAGATDPHDLLAELSELTAAHERLLELHRELLTQYAELLEHRAGGTASVTVPVVAGPFADGGALRAFEQDLQELSTVGEVTIREFLGGDRVAVDVRLA